MKLVKYLILLIIPVIAVLHGCESNDKVSNSVCIPQPVNRKVLVEFFTNSGCIPCVSAHAYLDEITSNTCATINDTSVIIISYHAKYPYILDSLYRANVTQNDARANYYGVLATPYASLDGVNMGQFSSVDWSSQINNEFRNSVTYMDITLTNSFNQNTDSGTVTANISLLSAVPTGDNVVHIIITESNIPYITAPNGVKYPDDVMRYMITGSDGEDITLSSNNVITKSYSLNSKWNKAECYLTVFVQSKSTKQIYGVGRIKVNQ